MQIYVYGQEAHSINVSETESIADLKVFVAEQEGLPVDEIKIYAGGKPILDDSTSVLSHGFSIFEANIGLKGGKVHGSLARAGKVKSQTTKVAKQEKKKKKTGRAKRRMQYNRRFVNALSTFGRRKGPNSNS